MKKQVPIIILTAVFAVILCLAACGKNGKPQDSSAPQTKPESSSAGRQETQSTVPEETAARSMEPVRRLAYEILDGEWIAAFDYDYLPEKETPPDTWNHYSFSILSLRHRFSKGWSVNRQINKEENGATVYYLGYQKPIRRNWFKENEARVRDGDTVYRFLKQQGGTSLEEMLSMDLSALEFEELDRDLLARLMRACLTDSQKDEHADAPPRQLMYLFDINVETDWMDGYRFQIGYYGQYNYIKEVYIDVLYKTGTAYNAYEQLSDLVEQGKASDGQKEAFARFQAIIEAIKEENSFIAQGDTYRDEVIGGIDFGRLYAFMEAYETYDFIFAYPGTARYGTESRLPLITEELTEEKYLARFGQYAQNEPIWVPAAPGEK